jgi:hypothetical protein
VGSPLVTLRSGTQPAAFNGKGGEVASGSVEQGGPEDEG